jgi:hypothetical protein
LQELASDLGGVERLQTFAEFEAMLARPGPWVGGFDFPFSLPRELVRDLGWPPPGRRWSRTARRLPGWIAARRSMLSFDRPCRKALCAPHDGHPAGSPAR